MSDRTSFWPTVLSFAGGMAACGLAMYMVNKLSDRVLEEEEEEEEDYEDYLLKGDMDAEELMQEFDMGLTQTYEDFDFDIDEEDIEDLEGLSMTMAQGGGHEISSDENSQNENNKHDGLSWTQTHEEVMLEFQIPAHVRAKDIQCKFNTNSILIQVEGDNLLAGGLHMPIQPDGCSWEIDGSGPSRLLLISLLKSPLSPGFWTEVTKTVTSEENDAEAQASKEL